MVVGMGNIVYEGVSFIWRSTLLKWYRNYKDMKKERYWNESRKKLGKENPDKVFYVIRRYDWYCGLFSIFCTHLQRIDDALKSGYIPVIDMQNDFNIYLDEQNIGKENAWEYYFMQPMGYSLRDISHSRNVIIGSGKIPNMFPFLEADFLCGKTIKGHNIQYWRELASKYMKLNDTAQRRIDEEYQRLFHDCDKVLGVLCRGTDYIGGRPKYHAVQPAIEQILKKVDEIFAERNCTKIFLATEDEKVHHVFEDKYRDRLIVNRRKYAQYQGVSIGKTIYENGNGGYEGGMQYLITIALLSKCHCLCAGRASGTAGACLMSEGYEYIYIFDLGTYE